MPGKVAWQTTPNFGLAPAFRKVGVDLTNSVRVSPLVSRIITPRPESGNLVNQNQVDILRESRITVKNSHSSNSFRVKIDLTST